MLIIVQTMNGHFRYGKLVFRQSFEYNHKKIVLTVRIGVSVFWTLARAHCIKRDGFNECERGFDSFFALLYTVEAAGTREMVPNVYECI